MDRTFDALVAFVEENDEGLQDVDELDKAVAVMERLMRAQMDGAGLIARASNSMFGEELLSMVFDHFAHTPNSYNFMLGLISSSAAREWFESSDGLRKRFKKLLLHGSASSRLISDYHKALFDRLHPLCNIVTADEYWGRKVRWYILKRDYRRSFDEIKKAGRGLLGECDTTRSDTVEEGTEYFFKASTELLIDLVHELYAIMEAKKLVDPMPEGNVSLNVNQTSEPGFGFAKDRFLLQWGNLPFSLVQHQKPYMFTHEGGMVLRIAAYMQTKRNEQRRQSHRRTVEAHQKDSSTQT